ncbi:hypothetical protein FRB95_003068 [Tulasnella sp. JGI-2019a]|nr:hypothetical protein FRB95_003068 [Tulasnella sp. JGI-2019a]
MAELSTEEFMSRFGRPLFWTMLSKKASVDIIGLARSKLILRHGINGPFNLLTPAAKTAVLDLRLRFEYEPTRNAPRTRDSDLVQSHMRFVQSIPKSREYMRSSYPSEPILAEAAAQQMNVAGTKLEHILQGLTDNCDSGMLDKGEQGELVARFLLTIAYDRAAKAKRRRLYSEAVDVETFISELFRQD